jgi:hypothetical protein
MWKAHGNQDGSICNAIFGLESCRKVSIFKQYLLGDFFSHHDFEHHFTFISIYYSLTQLTSLLFHAQNQNFVPTLMSENCVKIVPSWLPWNKRNQVEITYHKTVQ